MLGLYSNFTVHRAARSVRLRVASSKRVFQTAPEPCQTGHTGIDQALEPWRPAACRTRQRTVAHRRDPAERRHCCAQDPSSSSSAARGSLPVVLRGSASTRRSCAAAAKWWPMSGCLGDEDSGAA